MEVRRSISGHLESGVLKHEPPIVPRGLPIRVFLWLREQAYSPRRVPLLPLTRAPASSGKYTFPPFLARSPVGLRPA